MIVALMSGRYNEHHLSGLVELPDEEALAFEAEINNLVMKGNSIFRECCRLAEKKRKGRLSKKETAKLAEFRAESKENYGQQGALTQRIRDAAKPLEHSMVLELPGT